MEQSKTQKEKILDLFSRKKTWSNHELRDLEKEIGYQFPARIKELRAAGHDIRGHHDPNDRKKYYYTLYVAPKDLFQAA